MEWKWWETQDIRARSPLEREDRISTMFSYGRSFKVAMVGFRMDVELSDSVELVEGVETEGRTEAS